MMEMQLQSSKLKKVLDENNLSIMEYWLILAMHNVRPYSSYLKTTNRFSLIVTISLILA